jgi:hypothetical protein
MVREEKSIQPKHRFTAKEAKSLKAHTLPFINCLRPSRPLQLICFGWLLSADG